MPKREDLDKILVIGSGPIVIGQACEFDYSGTQALKALQEEGYRVVLVNSNPATIMTDPRMAWKIYIEPLTVEYISDIIKKERPQALLPTLGGQTALNLAVELSNAGVLEKYGVELIGARLESILRAESRKQFKDCMKEIGIEVPESDIASSMEESRAIAKKIGFPLIIRPAFTLGGTGGSMVRDEKDFDDFARTALNISPVGEILIEESIEGWKEFELELMRDKNDNCVVICSIENVDPMGVHTGDSITVAPAQTLTDSEYQEMRTQSFKIMRAMGVDTGGSNVQFAVHPKTGAQYAIEMNPRVSRSSALASKATGFPIAKIAAKLAVGYTMDELSNDITKKTPACFEPVIDYVVTKVPRFTFEKFMQDDQILGSAMKSVGEVMAIGRTFKESLQKAFRGLEINRSGLGADGRGHEKDAERIIRDGSSAEKKKFTAEIIKNLKIHNCDRLFYIKYALMLGIDTEEISEISGIDKWFVSQIGELVDVEKKLIKEPLSPEKLIECKRYGFSDTQLAYLLKKDVNEIRELREKYDIKPVYKSVDTCSAEFESYTPYFYSSWEEEDEAGPPEGGEFFKKVIIVGGGPNRIGQGIEFDYCICHASFALKEEGCFSIIVNSNPETVSTDYDTSDRLYFEPLTAEDVINIIEKEKPDGVIVQLGGQTPLNIIHQLAEKTSILGTSADAIDLAEDRSRFSKLLDSMGIPHTEWGVARSIEEAYAVAKRIGYPLMLRPSYVLGGRAMKVAFTKKEIEEYLKEAVEVNPDHPVLIDKFLEDASEVDVDCICDGEDVYIPPLMEHIEKAGIHSGDSACVTPPVSIPFEIKKTIKDYVKRIALKLKVVGLMNTQCAVKDGKVYILEVNPRASRTVPFISKAINMPLAKIATKVMLGRKLKEFDLRTKFNDYCVKEVVLPFLKFKDTDPVLGPEMRSTGEVMGRASSFTEAYYKSQLAAGNVIPQKGSILLSLSDGTKKQSLLLVEELNRRYDIYATPGTAEFLKENGIEVFNVAKIHKDKKDVEYMIKEKKVDLIINTPSGKGSYSDGYRIRRWAYENKIPLLTTLAAAKALSGLGIYR